MGNFYNSKTEEQNPKIENSIYFTPKRTYQKNKTKSKIKMLKM